MAQNLVDLNIYPHPHQFEYFLQNSQGDVVRIFNLLPG